MTRRFTPQEEDEIVDRYLDGGKPLTLALELGCGSEKPVVRVLRQRGVYEARRRSGTRLTRAQREELCRRYEAGASLAALSPEFGYSVNGLWKILKQDGVELRFHGRVEGRRIRNSNGYMCVQVDRDDPIAVSMGWTNGYVLEHRLVMARSLGRPLDDAETVHHINGDRTDNRLENLQLRNGRHGRGVALTCLDCGSHNIGPMPLT